jgi:hypothetical protein
MLRRPLAASSAAVLALACASPTLPLPPPETPTITLGPDADHVTLTATCNYPEHNTDIYIVNENAPNDKRGGIATADDCGAWHAIVYAHPRDPISITYILNGEMSLPTLIFVP